MNVRPLALVALLLLAGCDDKPTPTEKARSAPTEVGALCSILGRP